VRPAHKDNLILLNKVNHCLLALSGKLHILVAQIPEVSQTTEVIRLLNEIKSLLGQSNDVVQKNYLLLVHIDDNIRKIKFNTQ